MDPEPKSVFRIPENKIPISHKFYRSPKSVMCVVGPDYKSRENRHDK